MHVPSAASSRNPVDSVVALLLLLGPRSVGPSATHMLNTHMVTAYKHVNVSLRVNECCIRCFLSSFPCVLWYVYVCVFTKNYSSLPPPSILPPATTTTVVSVTSIATTAVASEIATRATHACPLCGTIEKTGKRSCCAPDGAWAQKCGDTDDPDFEHTWFQGTQACKGSGRSFAGKVRYQIHEITTAQHLNANRQHDPTQPQVKGFGVSDVDTTDSAGCHKLTEVYMFIKFLLMISTVCTCIFDIMFVLF